LTHDIIHGALHLDKGLLFTLKEITLRPGKVASNYIKGKRASYYNFFYLALILIGIILFLKGFKVGRIEHNTGVNVTNEVSYNIGRNIASKYFKYILLSFIPLFSVSSFLTYRKAKLNLAEHGIIAGISLIYVLIHTSVLQLLDLLFPKTNFGVYFFTISFLTLIFIYYQAFFDIYSKRKIFNLANAFLTIIMFLVLLFSIVSILIASAIIIDNK
jgi:hypothetical protein